MDYGSGGAEKKLDSQILLDYGALDPGSSQARALLSSAFPGSVLLELFTLLLIQDEQW